MNLSVSPTVFELMPTLRIGVVVVRGCNNTGASSSLEEKLVHAQVQLRTQLDPETFKEHPHLAAWQTAHRSFGSNPNKYPPSIQALSRRILKGGNLPHINPLVDCYNLASVTHMQPFGGADLDQLDGDLQLVISDGTEEFYGIGETQSDPPQPGEVIYRDSTDCLCRRFNWREANRIMLTPDTKNVVLLTEVLDPVTDEQLQESISFLASTIEEFCGGTVSTSVVDSAQLTLGL